MAYRMVYLRIQCSGYDLSSPGRIDLREFKDESRQMFQELGWTLHKGRNGICDTVTKDLQDLYLHPLSFSGVLDESNIPVLREQLSGAKTFRCYAVDCYEEYVDMSDEEYQSLLESKREEITGFTLEQYQTKRRNLYIVDHLTDRIAKHFEICRLCDKGRENKAGKQFVSELITQLLLEGRLVSAETTSGVGIRAATAKELCPCSQPAEQIEGQITMTF